jgi:hypothetical protein
MPAASQPAWSDANLKAHDVAAVARVGLGCGEIVRCRELMEPEAAHIFGKSCPVVAGM